MTTFLEDESGIETSQPREVILFQMPVQTVCNAIGTRDVVIDGRTYRASPASRGEITYATADNDADLIVQVPVSHAVPQRWMFGRVPPMFVDVTIMRTQVTSGETETVWRGRVESIEFGVDDIASLRVPARICDVHEQRIPQITVGTTCNHILYDANCTKLRADYLVESTVVGIDGRIVKVASISGKPDDWATYGELLHVASGERIAIGSQIGTTLTCQLNIPGVAIGDAVKIYAGCAHDIGTCYVKFGNQVNFGGFPQLPTRNIFRRTQGFGVVEQY